MRYCALSCLAALAWVACARGQTPEQKKATIEYLQSLQPREGGFRPSADSEQMSLRATSAAMRALKYFGGRLPGREEIVPKFVAGCLDKESGGFTDRPGEGKPDVVTTAVGLMALVELRLLKPGRPGGEAAVAYLGKNAKDFEDIRIAAAGLEAVDKLPPQAADWLKQLADLRNKEGTYGKGDGKARATGGAVVAVLRLGGKVENKEVVLKVLKEGQRPDGGFGKEAAKGSDLGTTYRVLRAFHRLGDVPDVKRLRAFVARCRNDDGGYAVMPGGKSSVGGTYFAATILHWVDKK